MKAPRSRRSVAFSLSAAVWPGAGQLYLRRFVLGAVLATSNLVLLILLVYRVLAGAAGHLAADPGASWVSLASHGLGQRSVLVLVGLLGATWGWGLLDVVLRPPQDDSRDSSHDSSAA